MRHRHSCPIRWADLDLLGHVNNVQHVDYLQEARHALIRGALQDAGIPRTPGEGYVVVRHELTYLAPLGFGSEPVMVESWVTSVQGASFTLEHEIVHEHADGSRTTYLRARSLMAAFQHDATSVAGGQLRRLSVEEKAALAPYLHEGEQPKSVLVDVPRDSALHHPVRVRFSDLDVWRHVNNVKFVEFFQEARIATFLQLRHALKDFARVNVVVAQTDLEYVAQAGLHAEPYDCWSVVSRIGRKSMTIESELVAPEGGVVARARVVMVFFDTSTQRSVEPPAGYTEAIRSALPVRESGLP